MDTLNSTQRSHRMSLIRAKNTKPEMLVRRLIHGMGYRYSLHSAKLPGKPDLVFRKRKKVIFVHGCFWHRHPSTRCKLARLPKSRKGFWVKKLEDNRKRDVDKQRELRKLGWNVLVIWECQLKNTKALERKIGGFLSQ